jgi:hypothetical protein
VSDIFKRIKASKPAECTTDVEPERPVRARLDDKAMLYTPELYHAQRRGRATKLTKAVARRICTRIRQGAFPHVAALAEGIGGEKFKDYLAKYPAFRHDCERAHGEVRAQVERHLVENEPKAWALKGPGRDKPGQPGWANTTRIEERQAPAPTQAEPFPFLHNLSETEYLEFERLCNKASTPLDKSRLAGYLASSGDVVTVDAHPAHREGGDANGKPERLTDEPGVDA